MNIGARLGSYNEFLGPRSLDKGILQHLMSLFDSFYGSD